MSKPYGPWRGLPGTREGLIWRRAHEIKRLASFESAAGIVLFSRFHKITTRKP